MKHLIALLMAASLALPVVAEAKGFSGGGFRSASSFRSYSAPRPMYRAPVRNVTVNKTVIQRNTVVQHAPASSGGGFFSSAAGSFAGAGLATWLFSPKPEAAPAAAPVVDCAVPQNKTLSVCLNAPK